MSEIVKDLRKIVGDLPPDGHPGLAKRAADEIERLQTAMRDACDLLAERTQGNAARSPAHNARLRLEASLHDD